MRLSHLLFSMRPPRLPTLEVTLSPSPFPSPPLPLPLSLCRSLYFDSRRSATSSGSLLFGYHVSSQRDKRLSVTAWRKYLSLHERLRFSLCMRLSVCSVASARVLTERPLLCMQAKRVSLNLQLGEASNRCSQSAFGRPSLRYTPLNRMNRSGVVIALVLAGLSAAYGLSEEQLQQLGLGTGPPEGARRAVAAASPQGLAGWEGAIPLVSAGACVAAQCKTTAPTAATTAGSGRCGGSATGTLGTCCRGAGSRASGASQSMCDPIPIPQPWRLKETPPPPTCLMHRVDLCLLSMLQTDGTRNGGIESEVHFINVRADSGL